MENNNLKNKTIYISNIPKEVTEQELKKIFEKCGLIEKILVVSPNTNSETKTCFIQFKERNSVEAAKLLTKTEILGKLIIVEDGQFAKEVPMQGISALSSIKNNNSPPSVPLSKRDKILDEIARTVYVGNIPTIITTEQLISFFSVCGPIVYYRMAGDDNHPARFAFIEFATVQAADIAIQLSGTTLLDRPIRVNHSKTPITKPIKKETSLEEEEIQRKLKAASDAINRKLKAIDEGKNPDEIDYRSKSRSRSRDRYRSRSRSRDRYRSRSGSRDRSRDRYRSRSRDSHKHRHKKRSRDRDRSRDRYRSRSRDKYKHRHKHRSKSRDRYRHNEDENKKKNENNGDKKES